MLDIAIARVTHEANRAYCATLGDDSQLGWDEAPGWQKTSALAGVRSILDGGVRRPADSHECWMKEKRDAGWVHGETKDPGAAPPTHPCMVPYAELPEEQRRKDALFFAIVNALK